MTWRCPSVRSRERGRDRLQQAPVGVGDHRSVDLPAQDCELVARHDDLEVLRAARTYSEAKQRNEETADNAVHEDSGSARIAAGQRPRPSFRHPQGEVGLCSTQCSSGAVPAGEFGANGQPCQQLEEPVEDATHGVKGWSASPLVSALDRICGTHRHGPQPFRVVDPPPPPQHGPRRPPTDVHPRQCSRRVVAQSHQPDDCREQPVLTRLQGRSGSSGILIVGAPERSVAPIPWVLGWAPSLADCPL